MFHFSSAANSNAAQGMDEIRAGDGAVAFEGVGQSGGDVFNLLRIDADSLAAHDQAFTFGDTGLGGLWLEDRDGATLVQGNTDNDADAEFAFLIQDGDIAASSYTQDDFIL